MRLAIHVKSMTPVEAELQIGLLDEDVILPITMSFKRADPKKPYVVAGIRMADITTAVHPEIVLEVTSQILKELSKHDPKTLTPLQLLQRAGKTGGRQIAFDGVKKKWVTVKNARDTESVWWAVDGKGEHIHNDACVDNANNQRQAGTFMKVRMADLMAEHPDKIAKLSSWFAEGCVIVEEKSGGVSWTNVEQFESSEVEKAEKTEKEKKAK